MYYSFVYAKKITYQDGRASHGKNYNLYSAGYQNNEQQVHNYSHGHLSIRSLITRNEILVQLLNASKLLIITEGLFELILQNALKSKYTEYSAYIRGNPKNYSTMVMRGIHFSLNLQL